MNPNARAKLFILQTCPYCNEARRWMKELQDENPQYRLPIELIDEQQYMDFANQFDYYLVPTFYLDDQKLHEGAASKQMIRNVLEQIYQAFAADETVSAASRQP